MLQRIRDIRSSERNFYQQVTDIYATSIDYDPRADITNASDEEKKKLRGAIRYFNGRVPKT